MDCSTRKNSRNSISVGVYWQNNLSIQLLLVAVATGLYPLIKIGVLDLVKEHKIGNEIFVTVATTITFLGGQYVADVVLMGIILIAEFIADLYTASTKEFPN